MISYDDDLLEAHYELAEENRFMDYEALGGHYSRPLELTDEDIKNIREGIQEHLVEVRKELSELTGTPVEELKRETESILYESELDERIV